MPNTAAFFAGVGTTFVILAVGFGGGLMMAHTAMEPHVVEKQARAPADATPSVRVILPASAEPAMPPQPSLTQVEHTVPTPPPTPALKEASISEKQVEKVDTRKAEAEERERRKRSAERKAKRLAEKARHQQQQEQERRDAPILAFGGDELRGRTGLGFFGN